MSSSGSGESGASGASGGPRAPKSYHRHRFHRFENALTTALTRAGLMPHSYVLTTVGRRTGQERRNPVTVVETDGRQWLVAPYGAVGWVLNARAAGEVSLTRRFSTTRYTVREAGAQEAGPVLKHYVAIAGVTRPYFAASVHDPPEVFAREADRHPVLELVPVGG